ncbi:hypothetical protein [Streptosporangium sp. NPDC049644]|uniref:hypothetical protein n=1 Tax=Streptosporangium sp. NPDC049644 TaxID=3155507 RepID=UPI0034428A0D
MSGSKRGVVIGTLFGLIIGGAGVAVAAEVAESEVITACVNRNGTVRIPQSSTPAPTSTLPQSLAALPTGSPTPGQQGCLDGEKEISWNTAGPQGVAGPSGPAGPAGPKGEAGISGVEVVENQVTIPALRQGSASVACPAGKKPISGGYAYGRADHWYLEDSMLVGYMGLSTTNGELDNTWGYRATNPNSYPVTVHLTALCAVLP